MPNNNNIQNLALNILSDALSGSKSGKKNLRAISKLLGKRASGGGAFNSQTLVNQLFDGLPSSNTSSGFDNGFGGNDFIASLVGSAVLGLLNNKSNRTTSAESARSRDAAAQQKTMRLSSGQQAVMLAEIIRRAERNL